MSNLLEKASILLTPTGYDNGSMNCIKPNTSVGDFDFTRGTAATRVNSQGLIEDVQILSGNLVQNGDFEQVGSELVTNGRFDTDSNWTKDSGWSIANGEAICNGVGINSLQQSGITTTGKSYKLTFDIISKSSDDFLIISTNFGDTYVNGSSTNIGTNTFYINPTSGTGIRFRVADGTTLTIDNVSIKEVGQNWEFGSGWSIGDGVANFNGTNASIRQDVGLQTGKKYKITFTTNVNQGGIAIVLGGSVQLSSVTTSGTHTFYGVSGVNSILYFQPTSFEGQNFQGSIDNISVIEITDDTNLPRIDYTDGTGSLLLEPQSTNTATYSNDFTQGDVFNSSSNPGLDATVLTSQQATSPDGTNNAWLLKDDNSGGTGTPNLRYFGTTVNSNYFNTFSIFAKKALTNDFIALATASFDSSANGNTWFNISNGTLGNVNNNHTAKIEDYGNGWYRCQITFKTTTDVQGAIRIRLSSTNGDINCSLDGTNGSYIFGLQCEASATQNFATSYIPTSGSTVTRNQDVCINSGSSDLINSTEGVLYAEVSALSTPIDGNISRMISLSDAGNGGKGGNILLINIPDTNVLQPSPTIRAALLKGRNVETQLITTAFTVTDNLKIAFKYKQDDFALWINGVEAATDTSGETFAADKLNLLNFRFGNQTSANFNGKVKCVAVFEEALTDSELTCLTS